MSLGLFWLFYIFPLNSSTGFLFQVWELVVLEPAVSDGCLLSQSSSVYSSALSGDGQASPLFLSLHSACPMLNPPLDKGLCLSRPGREEKRLHQSLKRNMPLRLKSHPKEKWWITCMIFCATSLIETCQPSRDFTLQVAYVSRHTLASSLLRIALKPALMKQSIPK